MTPIHVHCAILIYAVMCLQYHYVLICPFFKESRKLYIKPYFYTRPNLLKFEKLFSSSNKRTITRLAKFAHLILNQF